MASIMRLKTTISNNVAIGGGLWVQHWGGTPNVTNAQLAVDATRDALLLLTTAFTSNLSWTVSGSVDVIDDVTGALVDQLGVTPRSGNATGGLGTTVPHVIQCLVQLRTQTFVAGRRLIGHMNIPGLLEANRSGDNANSTAVTQLQNMATSLANANPGLLIWSRTHGTSAEVVTGLAQQKLSVLRSRRD